MIVILKILSMSPSALWRNGSASDSRSWKYLKAWCSSHYGVSPSFCSFVYHEMRFSFCYLSNHMSPGWLQATMVARRWAHSVDVSGLQIEPLFYHTGLDAASGVFEAQAKSVQLCLCFFSGGALILFVTATRAPHDRIGGPCLTVRARYCPRTRNI